MNAKHTPGPWINLGQGDIVARSDKYCGGEKDIASVFLTTNDEDESNARLIAAAPDLLDALRELLEACKDAKFASDPFDSMPNARTAIAKATGETV